MKTVFALVAVLFFAALLLWPRAAREGPVLIAYGKDGCAHCRMIISERGLGGELRDGHGTLTKYDDVGCLLLSLWQRHEEVPEAWVEDHAGGGFVPLLAARFVRGGRVTTPMGYGVVAFRDEAAARTFAQEQQAQVATLEDLLRDKDRFAGKQPHAGSP